MDLIPNRNKCVFMLVILVGTPCCVASGAGAKEAPPVFVKQAATSENAAASAWLEAVREKDAAKVARLSGVPFVEVNLRNHKGCSFRGPIQTAADIQRLAGCVVGYELLVESIPASTEHLAWESIPLASVPKRFRTKLRPLVVDHALLRGYVMGDGVTFTILMAVRHSGIVDAVLSEIEVVE